MRTIYQSGMVAALAAIAGVSISAAAYANSCDDLQANAPYEIVFHNSSGTISAAADDAWPSELGTPIYGATSRYEWNQLPAGFKHNIDLMYGGNIVSLSVASCNPVSSSEADIVVQSLASTIQLTWKFVLHTGAGKEMYDVTDASSSGMPTYGMIGGAYPK